MSKEKKVKSEDNEGIRSTEGRIKKKRKRTAENDDEKASKKPVIDQRLFFVIRNVRLLGSFVHSKLEIYPVSVTMLKTRRSRVFKRSPRNPRKDN